MDRILVGKGEGQVELLGRFGNRHGLVAGATGTGKTVTLMVLAEGFSRMGVPVFMADVKGDVAGLAVAGNSNEKLLQRVEKIGIEGYKNEPNPVIFWDVFGQAGHPLRTTVSEIGPTLLARMLELSDVQAGVLEIAFKLADDDGLLLLDADDLRALLTYVADNRADISKKYGLVSTQSVAAIQRAMLGLEREGGASFLGEPALDLNDLMRTDLSGRGIINVLAADRLYLKPRLFSSFLLWLLSQLYENLPEVGDLDRPKLAFFFDEAHLLFNGAPPALRQRVEQVVRLIRSKGVGVYFCSQFPDDIPTEILGQLGNRVQHALRAFTPRDQKAVKTAAETFVPNPNLNVRETLQQLGVGEALVSTLQDKGIPMPVQHTMVAPPRCRMGAISDDERALVMSRSPVGARYDTAINRDSAFEILNRRIEEQQKETEAALEAAAKEKATAAEQKAAAKSSATADKERSAVGRFLWGSGRRQGMVESLAKQATRTASSAITRQIIRGVLGGITGSKKK